MTTAFFYGVLIHPTILKRVLNNDASHLQICPAILTDYVRHKVKVGCALTTHDVWRAGIPTARQAARHGSEDYPAIVPCERSRAVFGRELTAEENSVRGALVSGLTTDDITFLDVFEGNMYGRWQVRAHPLGPFTPFPADATSSFETVEDSNFIPTTGLQPLAMVSEAEPIEAQSYVWCLEDSRLDKELWTFEEFSTKNAWRWLGKGAQDNEDYAEVDAVRERFRAGPNGA